MSRQIAVTLPEAEYAWLLKNLANLSVPWRTPHVWERTRMRLTSALMAARTDQEMEAVP